MDNINRIKHHNVTTKVTYAQVAEVADIILSKNELPNVLSIRGLLSEVPVSNAEVSKYLSIWKKKQLKKLKEQNVSPDHPLLQAIQAEEDFAKKADDLEYSLALVRSTLEATTDGIMVVDKEGHIVNCNQKFIKMWGIPMDLVQAGDEQKALEHVMSQMVDPQHFYNIVSKTYSDLEDINEINEVTFKDGRIFELYSQAHRVNDHTIGRVWSARDVTQRRNAAEQIRVRNLAIEASPNGIIIIDVTSLEKKIIYANAAYACITECSLEKIIGQKWNFLEEKCYESTLHEIEFAFKEHREARVELKRHRLDSQLSWLELHIAPVTDTKGIISYYVGILVDITNHKILEQQLTHQATHDTLTNLPNRELLLQHLKKIIPQAKRLKKIMALLFLDLDQFKLANDTLGHDMGDILLTEVGERLAHSVRESDIVARLGGDEFVIVLSFLENEEDVYKVANKVLFHLSKPFKLDPELDLTVSTTASIGISFYPKDGKNAKTLLKHADIAMYKAKNLGRNRIELFNAEMNAQLMKRVEIEEDLRIAILREEFTLYLQPVVDTFTQKIVSFEALIRWPHPKKGMISPLEFISIAEETDLIVPIGEWVLKRTCQIQKNWMEQGLPNIPIAVNISGKQMKQRHFLSRIQHIIEAAAGDPHFLYFEVTESILIDNVDEVAKLLKSLQQYGIRISIDDFGTGYSSLSYLKMFNINTLKIDQSFVKDMSVDKSNVAIIQAIIALAHTLRMKVIAEGVEHKEELSFLEDLKCDAIQGYYFSRPLDIEHATNLFRAQCENLLTWPSAMMKEGNLLEIV